MAQVDLLDKVQAEIFPGVMVLSTEDDAMRLPEASLMEVSHENGAYGETLRWHGATFGRLQIDNADQVIWIHLPD